MRMAGFEPRTAERRPRNRVYLGRGGGPVPLLEGSGRPCVSEIVSIDWPTTTSIEHTRDSRTSVNAYEQRVMTTLRSILGPSQAMQGARGSSPLRSTITPGHRGFFVVGGSRSLVIPVWSPSLFCPHGPCGWRFRFTRLAWRVPQSWSVERIQRILNLCRPPVGPLVLLHQA